MEGETGEKQCRNSHVQSESCADQVGHTPLCGACWSCGLVTAAVLAFVWRVTSGGAGRRYPQWPAIYISQHCTVKASRIMYSEHGQQSS